MVKTTFLARCKRIGSIAGATLLLSGCAAILGNDYDVETDAGLGSGGAGPSTSTSSSGGASTQGTGGRTGSVGGGGSSSGGAGGDVDGGAGASVTGGAGGVGGSAAGASGASGGASGTSGGAAGAAGGAGGSAGAGGAAGSVGADASGGGGPDASDAADTSSADTAPETSPDAAIEASGDASVDAYDAGVQDAPPDVPPCNPLNGSCSNGVLTCNQGFSSCNASNTDGCECATPSCCGTACQNQHVACMLGGNPSTPCTDGTGKYYYDCTAIGTTNDTQATKACVAVTGNAAACSVGTCGSGPNTQYVVCSFGGTGACSCWEYFGPYAGHMFKNTTSSCTCPVSTSPTWN